MLPGIGPGAVTERVADAIIGDGCAVIGGQQVAPGGIAVGIMRLIQQFPRYSEGESILVPCPNIACIIVDPNPGLARKGVVFPNQLIGSLSC